MNDYTVLDIETEGCQPWERPDWLVSVGIGPNVYRPPIGKGLARMLLVKPGATIVAHTNYDLRMLMLDGAELGPETAYHDTKVMAHVLDSTQELALDALAQRYLGYTPPKVLSKSQGRIMFRCADGSIVPIAQAPWPELVAYNASDTRTEGELYEVLRAELQHVGRWERFLEEEAPFSRLLVEIETAGLPCDVVRIREMLVRVRYDLDALRERLVERTGAPEFNPGSPAQVADYLYEEIWTSKVKFPIPRLAGMSAQEKAEAVERIKPSDAIVTKIGRDYAYGELVLEGRGLRPPKQHWRDEEAGKRPTVSGKILNVLHGDNPWVADYVAWLGKDKLRGYLESWIEKEHDGRLHGRLDQAGTVTGRLTGKEPNLQQVSHSADVRDLFRGDLVVGDYAGLEVRLSAHFSGDQVMLDIFRNGKDLYGVLAAHAWGGPETKENPGRGLMKVVVLASQYGAQGEKLAQTLAIAGLRGYTGRKADGLLRDLENTLPRLFEWRQEVIEEARARGYVTTLSGRQRQLPNLGSAVWHEQAKAERQAVNSTVQGSAADVVRQAMLKARKDVPPEMARIVLQVHDEILWERGPLWNEDVFPRLVQICEHEHGFDLDVPLVFEAKVADSWAAKGGSGGQVEAGAYEHLEAA